MTTVRVRDLIEALQQMPPDDPIWGVGWYDGATRVWELDGAGLRSGIGCLPSPVATITLASADTPESSDG